MSPTISEIKISLPNFPEEVLEQWIAPYAECEGWPPASSENEIPSGRWRYLLKNQPLSYWQSIVWQKVDRHISIYDLHPEYRDIVVQLVLGAVEGQRNIYSSTIKDLIPRFNRITEYFSAHGKFPKSPALLAEPGGLTIADGNHRMAAYFYCYGYFTIDPGAELQLKTEELQSYWLGKT